MRLRHIPGAEQMIEENPHVVHGAKEKKGTWQQIFGNDHPIRIEVGMGKGQFILEQASRNPDVNFVGIEKYSTVLLKAIRKREQMELSNIYFLCEDARELAEIFWTGGSRADLFKFFGSVAEGPTCETETDLAAIYGSVRSDSPEGWKSRVQDGQPGFIFLFPGSHPGGGLAHHRIYP